uniref:Uncharacterized protein n=1 Tax=Anguilla anguilla TaxID=7936 RepID=A0A0E9X8E9_ANGAN
MGYVPVVVRAHASCDACGPGVTMVGHGRKLKSDRPTIYLPPTPNTLDFLHGVVTMGLSRLVRLVTNSYTARLGQTKAVAFLVALSIFINPLQPSPLASCQYVSDEGLSC